MKLAWCPESGPANWAENLTTKSCLTVNVACAQLPLHDCTHRLDARLDYNAKGSEMVIMG